MKTDDQLIGEIDETAIFAGRMRIVRARASMLLADVRDMCELTITPTTEGESHLRYLEMAVSNAMHFAGQLKRGVK